MLGVGAFVEPSSAWKQYMHIKDFVLLQNEFSELLHFLILHAAVRLFDNYQRKFTIFVFFTQREKHLEENRFYPQSFSSPFRFFLSSLSVPTMNRYAACCVTQHTFVAKIRHN